MKTEDYNSSGLDWSRAIGVEVSERRAKRDVDIISREYAGVK